MSEDDGVPPLTQSSGKSRVQYAWIFLFDENINLEDPFSIVPLSYFKDVENFPWTVIEGEMNSECRSETRTFTNILGQFKIFGKIEKGRKHSFTLSFISFTILNM